MMNLSSQANSTTTAKSDAATGIFATFLVLVNILIISGNITVLLVLYRLRKQAGLRVANMFLANLAVMDLSIGFFVMPFSVVTTIVREWIFEDAGCQLNGFINMFSGTGSILTMATIAIDRYRAIVLSPGHKLQVLQHGWILLGVVWVWSVVIGILPVLGWNEYRFGELSSVCKTSFSDDTGYLFLAAVTCFAIPLVIMFYCYLCVFLKVRSHGRRVRRWSVRSSTHEENNIRGETRTAKIVFTVLSVFAICWLPFVIVHLLQVSPNIDVPSGVFAFVTFIAACHSACNPVIYVAMNRKFRAEFLRMCPCLKRVPSLCCCCRKGPLTCAGCGLDSKVRKSDLEVSENSYRKSPLTSPDSAVLESVASASEVQYDASTSHIDVLSKVQQSES